MTYLISPPHVYRGYNIHLTIQYLQKPKKFQVLFMMIRITQGIREKNPCSNEAYTPMEEDR